MQMSAACSLELIDRQCACTRGSGIGAAWKLLARRCMSVELLGCWEVGRNRAVLSRECRVKSGCRHGDRGCLAKRMGAVGQIHEKALTILRAGMSTIGQRQQQALLVRAPAGRQAAWETITGKGLLFADLSNAEAELRLKASRAPASTYQGKVKQNNSVDGQQGVIVFLLVKDPNNHGPQCLQLSCIPPANGHSMRYRYWPP